MRLVENFIFTCIILSMADNRCIVYIYKVAAVVKHYLEQTSSEPRGALRGKVEDQCMLSQLSECWGVSETKINNKRHM